MSRIQALDFFGSDGPPCTVKFLIEGHEEEGSPYLGEFVQAFKEQLQAEAALYSGWARAVDGSPRINGGGRGGFSVKLTARGPKQSLHGSYTPIAPNASLRLLRAVVPVRSRLDARVWDVVRAAAEAVYGRLRRLCRSPPAPVHGI